MQLEAVILKDVLPYLKARKTFLRRGAFAGVAAFMVAVGGAGAAYGTAREQSATGGALFNAILWMILAVGTVQCTFLGATAVSSERQRNTVDIWILAGMEHFWMVAAKVASVLTRTASIAIAPVVPAAVALYLGGRSIIDASVGFLAVASIMVFAAALSVSVSSLCKRNSDSIPASIAAMLGFAVGPGIALGWWGSTKVWGSAFAAGLAKFHPFSLLMGIGEERGADFVITAFWGLVLSVIVSLVLMALAGAHLRGGGDLTVEKLRPVLALDRLLERIAPGFYRLFKPAPGDPDEDPILWRERVAFRNSRALFGAMTVTDKMLIAGLGLSAVMTVLAQRPRIAIGFGAVSTAGLVAEALFKALIVLMFLYGVTFIVRSSQAFSREFETSDIDLLQITRLSGEEIVSGKLRAYVRHYSPAMAVALVWGVALAVLALVSNVFSTPIPGMGIPWLRAAGWVVAGFAAAGLALTVSLYAMITTRAIFMALLLYFGPSMLLTGMSMSLVMVPSVARLIVQSIIGAIILLRAVSWARQHVGLKSRQECLLITVVSCFGAAVSGPILGPFVIYVVTKALMEKNFEQFLMHEADRYRIVLRRPALSYEYSGRYRFTHLGVPPAVERKLSMPEQRSKIKEYDN